MTVEPEPDDAGTLCDDRGEVRGDTAFPGEALLIDFGEDNGEIFDATRHEDLGEVAWGVTALVIRRVGCGEVFGLVLNCDRLVRCEGDEVFTVEAALVLLFIEDLGEEVGVVFLTSCDDILSDDRGEFAGEDFLMSSFVGVNF